MTARHPTAARPALADGQMTSPAAAVMNEDAQRLPRGSPPQASTQAAPATVLTLEQAAAWDGPPLILFIGVSTGGSLAHTVFAPWAAVLGRPWRLAGIDLPPTTPARTYWRLAGVIRDNPAIQGAVITAHKLRLYRACAAGLSHCDQLAVLTRELNTLARGTSLTGYARDALSLAHILPTLTARSGATTLAGLHVLCLGAGGAATALLLALHLDIGDDTQGTLAPHANPPARVIFADTSRQALADLRAVASRAQIPTAHLSFAHVRGASDCDKLAAGLPTPALVINATGLGKDRPGSPLTAATPLGPATLAWDLNYRGTLTYLYQATARGAPVVDGWDYFVAGWAGALTAIAGVRFTGGLLAQFAQAAAPHRPPPAPTRGREHHARADHPVPDPGAGGRSG